LIAQLSGCHLNRAHKIYYTSYKIKHKLLHKAQNVSFSYLTERGILFNDTFNCAVYVHRASMVSEHVQVQSSDKMILKGEIRGIEREVHWSWIWCRVYWHMETDVSKEHTASIIRIIHSTWLILGGVDKFDLRRFL
jgi:hypothetical protein